MKHKWRVVEGGCNGAACCERCKAYKVLSGGHYHRWLYLAPEAPGDQLVDGGEGKDVKQKCRED